ncbi:hypothetical protein BB559_000633 [Furculomyces boomerangus]|uniref:Uncharacterized protein n=1 Tax=Furculomyces boomerangus TaxID=61424 RepID=A0A2T9Z4P9_9FUNG|nr:hypothetical protein BB559_000633 [Furculomyces boomerangus]
MGSCCSSPESSSHQGPKTLRGGLESTGPIRNQPKNPNDIEMKQILSGNRDSGKKQSVNVDLEEARIQRANAVEERMNKNKYRGVQRNKDTKPGLADKLDEVKKSSAQREVQVDDNGVLKVSIPMYQYYSFFETHD